MKTFLIATMLGSAAMIGSAFAQQSVEPDAAQPVDPAPQTEDTQVPGTEAAPQEGQQAGTDDQIQGEQGFLTWQAEDQMIASNLLGADVWGAEDEVIGNVDDLLLDRDGQIIAVVVGIGGFLGIGQSDVAISTDQLDFVLTQDVQAGVESPATDDPVAAPEQDPTVAPQPGGVVAPGAAAPMTDTTGAAPGTAPAPDLVAPGTAAPAITGTGWGWGGGVIDHIRVNYTRAQLESAPQFETIE